MFDEKFLGLINQTILIERPSIMSDTEVIADNINKLLIKQDVMEIDKESLVDKIKGLSENALLGLVEAIKDKKIYRILSILEIEFSQDKGIIGDK